MSPSKHEFRRNRTVNVGSIIDTVLKKYRLSDGLLLSWIRANRKIIFEEYALAMEPISIRRKSLNRIDGIVQVIELTVKVEDSVSRHKANEFKNYFLRNLEQYAPDKITDIFYI